MVVAGGQGKVSKEQGARCQERRNAAPPSARKEPLRPLSHNVNLRDGSQDVSRAPQCTGPTASVWAGVR
jgi:hypothetical protein